MTYNEMYEQMNRKLKSFEGRQASDIHNCLLEMIIDLQRKVTELQDAVRVDCNETTEAVEPVKKEWPQKGDTCYYLNSGGAVLRFTWLGDDPDQEGKNQGLYRTEEAAEMEALRRECRASAPKVDWTLLEQIYCFNRETGTFTSFLYLYVPYGTIDSGLYGRTREEATDRWNKYGKAFTYLVTNQE
jgi:hypothetical protein